MEISKENDQKVLSIICNEDGSINSGHGKWSYFTFHHTEFYDYLANRFKDLNDKSNIREIIVRLQLGIEEPPICPVCGNPVKFDGRTYPVFCSHKCYRSDEGKRYITIQKEETCLEIYGVTCVLANEEVKAKSRETWQKNYGTDHPSKNEAIAKKISESQKNMTPEQKAEKVRKAKETTLERHGDENYRNTEQSRQTCKERYGVEYVLQLEEVKEKSRQTCKEHFGVEYSSQSEEVKEKSRQTCRDRYNTDYVTQTQNQKDKSRQTCREHFGCDYAMQNEEVQKRALATKRERYGDHYEEPHKKATQTKFEKYGDPYYYDKDKMRQTKRERYGDPNYHNMEKAKETWQKNFGHDNPQRCKEINDRSWETRKARGNQKTSAIEENINKWFIENNIQVERNYNKDPRYPYHVDFHLTDFDVFIEIQGYWSHGYHPFDENNPDDIQTLNKWINKNTEQYKGSIVVWTVKDPEKRQTAKDNNLNYLEIFTCKTDEAIDIIATYLKEKI